MEEKDFKNMMQHSKLEIQFPDFDENVMEKIYAREVNRRLVRNNLKKSWIFFIIGSLFGIFATQSLTNLQVPFLSLSPKLILLIVEILIVIVVVSQFDNLIQFTFRKRE